MTSHAPRFIALAVCTFATANCERHSTVETDPFLQSTIEITAKLLEIAPESISPNTTFDSLCSNDLDFTDILRAAEDIHGVNIRGALLYKGAEIPRLKINLSRIPISEITVAELADILKSAPKRDTSEGHKIVTLADLEPIRHYELSDDHKLRIQKLVPVFEEVFPNSYEEWIDGFERETDPEGELAMWEQMAAA